MIESTHRIKCRFTNYSPSSWSARIDSASSLANKGSRLHHGHGSYEIYTGSIPRYGWLRT